MIDLSKLDRPPAGFAACAECAYRDTGSAPVCFTCASERTEPTPERACPVCEQRLQAGETCGNPLCGWEDRFFSRVWAISMRTGEMRSAITRYKYQERWGWAIIFGRILVGFLDEHAPTFRPYDLIIPSPSFVGVGAERSFDHTRRIVEAAQVEEPIAWPFAYGVIVKTQPTERLVDKNWQERKEIAEIQIRASLSVPDASRIEAKRVLVVDDVFTEGFTIREAARSLVGAGASEVSEIVLAREPWKGT